MAPELQSQPENLETATPLDITADVKLKQGQVEKLALEAAKGDPSLAATAEAKKDTCLNRLATLGSQTMEKIGGATNQTYQKINSLFQ